MDGPFFLKARSNISLDGDLRLAEMEIQRFFEVSGRVSRYEDLRPHLRLPSRYVYAHARDASPLGFIGFRLKTNFRELITSLSFIQEIWAPSTALPAEIAPKEAWWDEISTDDGCFTCAVPLMAAGEYLTSMKTSPVSTSNLAALTTYLGSTLNGDTPLAAAVGRTNTSNPHVHGLHKYKAKFFPRLVRHLLVTHLPRTPKDRNGRRIVLDPFVGSGTSVIEAGLLGIPSIGIDIDRLSCAISRTKIHLASADPSFVSDGIGKVLEEFSAKKTIPTEAAGYTFPPWIARKFERNHAGNATREYEGEIARWIYTIDAIPIAGIREIAEICLSDALSRKFHIRMMGTGVGRFALEIRTASITSLMESNLLRAARMSRVVSTLVEGYRVHMEPPRILHADAQTLPLPDDSISMVVTSPPYLPASSGREDYLVGKSIAITALGLMHPDGIARSESRSIGSMKATGPVQIDDLPAEVQNLYAWLQRDPLRRIKADPIALYYQDLTEALHETYRVLIPGGLAIYIVGKESVFYSYKDRQILYTVPCDRIFLQMAVDCGFTVDTKIDLELDKKQGCARPRSTDDYYESICVLAKPA